MIDHASQIERGRKTIAIEVGAGDRTLEMLFVWASGEQNIDHHAEIERREKRVVVEIPLIGTDAKRTSTMGEEA